MEPFTTLTASVAVLPDADIDTDIIFPARFLLITEKSGLGRYAFYDRRYADGIERADFPLKPAARETRLILIAGDNFGCGSSREQAVWALYDLGVRCVLAPSFGEIFHANCFKNGLLPITLPADILHGLAAEPSLTVDLTECRILSAALGTIGFQVPAWRRAALLNGWDEILTLLNTDAAAITAFEATRRAQAPWLFAADSTDGGPDGQPDHP